MNKLSHNLFGGKTINSWILSEIFEEVKTFRPMTMSGGVNEWLKHGFSIHENPCRGEFVNERRRDTPVYKDFDSFLPNNQIDILGASKNQNIYFPFDNVNVEYSAFWYVPTYLQAYAACSLLSPSEHKAQFELRTCGGATVWVNGKLIIDFTPYTRNIEQITKFDAVLVEGENQVVICFDDLAERDTQYYFRLDYLGEQTILNQINIGENSEKLINNVENMLYLANFTDDNFLTGDVLLNINNNFTESIILNLQAASEENLSAGKKVAKEVEIKSGTERVNLGEITSFGIGFFHFALNVEVCGIKITRVLSAQLYPLEIIPQDKDVDIIKRKEILLNFLAKYGEANIHKAVALLYTNGDAKEAETIILKELVGINARKDCSDFYLVVVFRIWRDFRETSTFTEEFWAKVKDTILNFRYWMDEPGDDVMWFFSENHALLFHICQLSAGQIFPDETFTNSGLKGHAMVKKAENLLYEWFEKFFNEGFTEWNSSAYLPIDILGFANLYDQAQTPKLKEYARKGMDAVYYYLAINAHDGVLACSQGRSYEKELKGNYTNGTSSMLYIGYGCGYINQAGKAAVSLCLIDYVPPVEYEKYLNVEAGKAIVFKNNQGFERHVDLYLYKTSNYLLSTAINFKTNKKGYQEHVLQATISPTAQVFINHPGETHTFGSGRPNFWAGNGYLPKANQYKGFAAAIYNIDESHSVSYTHAYFPTFSFDETVNQGNWFFARKDNVFLAVYAKGGLKICKAGANKGRELVSQGYKNLWLVRICDKSEFADFSIFTNHMLNMPLNIDDNNGYVLTDKILGEIKMSANEDLKVNGKKVDYTGFSIEGEIEIF